MEKNLLVLMGFGGLRLFGLARLSAWQAGSGCSWPGCGYRWFDVGLQATVGQNQAPGWVTWG